MRRFCQRARDRQTDLIVTASDEAFYTLFACGDSLPLQIPVVFFGIKYPDTKLITTHPNVCGFTANPDFDVILRQAQKIFPRRKEVVCVIDNSFLSNKGLEDFEEEWKIFQKDNPDYRMKIYNTQIIRLVILLRQFVTLVTATNVWLLLLNGRLSFHL